MRIALLWIVVLTVGVAGVVAVSGAATSPERTIQGTWSEQSWEYEKVDKNLPAASLAGMLSDDVKELIGKELIIHEAEYWTFYPDGRLHLGGDRKDRWVSWRIKGRGNILQLKFDDNLVENYELTTLDDNTMQLNFETDVYARGIAKLTFRRQHNN